MEYFTASEQYSMSCGHNIDKERENILIIDSCEDLHIFDDAGEKVAKLILSTHPRFMISQIWVCRPNDKPNQPTFKLHKFIIAAMFRLKTCNRSVNFFTCDKSELEKNMTNLFPTDTLKKIYVASFRQTLQTVFANFDLAEKSLNVYENKLPDLIVSMITANTQKIEDDKNEFYLITCQPPIDFMRNETDSKELSPVENAVNKVWNTSIKTADAYKKAFFDTCVNDNRVIFSLNAVKQHGLKTGHMLIQPSVFDKSLNPLRMSHELCRDTYSTRCKPHITSKVVDINRMPCVNGLGVNKYWGANRISQMMIFNNNQEVFVIDGKLPRVRHTPYHTDALQALFKTYPMLKSFSSKNNHEGIKVVYRGWYPTPDMTADAWCTTTCFAFKHDHELETWCHDLNGTFVQYNKSGLPMLIDDNDQIYNYQLINTWN